MSPPLRLLAIAVALGGCHNAAVDTAPDADLSAFEAIPLTLDQPCVRDAPAGFLNPTGRTFTSTPATGQELLALLHPSYPATYVPQGVPAGYTWHGSLDPTAITIGTHYDGGAVSCGPVLCSCDPPGPCSVDRCQDPVLSVVIAQTYVTADGTFDEHVTGPVQSSQSARISFSGELAATQLQGTYQVSFDRADRVTMAFGTDVTGTSVVAGGVVEAAPAITGGGGSFQ